MILIIIGSDTVLMLMMAEVIATDLLFVLAIGAHGAPTYLERERQQHHDEKEFFHYAGILIAIAQARNLLAAA